MQIQIGNRSKLYSLIKEGTCSLRRQCSRVGYTLLEWLKGWLLTLEFHGSSNNVPVIRFHGRIEKTMMTNDGMNTNLAVTFTICARFDLNINRLLDYGSKA